jgi:hypothetical protein
MPRAAASREVDRNERHLGSKRPPEKTRGTAAKRQTTEAKPQIALANIKTILAKVE